MSRFTIFVGGVHGSGKSCFSQQLQKEIVCDHVSASDILQWSTTDKTVENVGANQELLSSIVPYAIRADKTFVIDGHFVLWNKERASEKVPVKFFESCKPDVLVVVTEMPGVIAGRLHDRDGLSYEIDDIEKLQREEIENASSISEKLGIPLYVIASTNREEIKTCISKIKTLRAEYTRDNISSEMLKTVIIRFDYVGGTNITQFVDEIKQQDFIKEAFGALHKIEKPQYSITVNTSDIEAGLLPTAERQKSTIYRFSQCTYDEGLNVILDVSDESVCLTIDCRRNYQGSDRYTELIGKLIPKLKDFDSFISVGRIGIRKIDSQIIAKDDEISNYFNENFVASCSWHKSPKERVNYVDFFKIGRVNFNMIQHISRNRNGEIQAILDVDAFIVNGDIEALINDEAQLIDFMNNEMQDRMFELFVSCASKSYLEKCKQAKTRK